MFQTAALSAWRAMCKIRQVLVFGALCVKDGSCLCLERCVFQTAAFSVWSALFKTRQLLMSGALCVPDSSC